MKQNGTIIAVVLAVIVLIGVVMFSYQKSNPQTINPNAKPFVPPTGGAPTAKH